MTSVVTNNEVKEDTNDWDKSGFWEKFMTIYELKEKPRSKQENSYYNFCMNILNKHELKSVKPKCPSQGKSVAEVLKPFAGMTKLDAMKALFKSKGWPYKARAKLSEAPTDFIKNAIETAVVLSTSLTMADKFSILYKLSNGSF